MIIVKSLVDGEFYLQVVGRVVVLCVWVIGFGAVCSCTDESEINTVRGQNDETELCVPTTNVSLGSSS